jgi:hypothetical protein
MGFAMAEIAYLGNPPTCEKPTAAREAAMRQPREDFLEV